MNATFFAIKMNHRTKCEFPPFRTRMAVSCERLPSAVEIVCVLAVEQNIEEQETHEDVTDWQPNHRVMRPSTISVPCRRESRLLQMT